MSKTQNLIDAVVEAQIAEADRIIASPSNPFASVEVDLDGAQESLRKAEESIPALQLLTQLRQDTRAVA